MELQIPREDERRLKEELKKRNDFEALRIRRYLDMRDLSRTEGSPLAEIVRRVQALSLLQDFDVIEIPEIVPAEVSFDLFNFPLDHPARSKSDTYYIDAKNILRTHDTVFWYYYLRLPEIQEKIARGEPLSALCYGKVYRKDEIDRRHMNIFHQMGGWHLIPNSSGGLSEKDLKDVLSQIVTSIFGADIAYRFNIDTFPYTDPSLEVEVKIGEEWVEILGGGMPKASVLKTLGLTGYNGWAFGFGLERLAIISMQLPDIRLLWSLDDRVKEQLVLGQPYKTVSKYPPSVRDISFVVSKTFVPNNYFDLVREVAGDLVEEVGLLDKYENNAKFGEDKMSYAFRITYRALDHTLKGEEVDVLHKKLEAETQKDFGASVR